MSFIAFLSDEQRDWKSLWNKALVFLFICTYFLNDITRYKHLIIILMIITTLYYIVKQPGDYLRGLKNYIFYSVAFLTVVMLVSLFITPDITSSFKALQKSVLESLLLFTIAIPVILRDESFETISKLITYAFLAALSLLCITELIPYIQDYKKGIMPFTDYRYRGISDSLVYLFPALLNLWLFKKIKHKVAFIVLGAVFIFLLLGTLSRGAWLAILVAGLAWVILAKQWKILFVGMIFAAVTAAAVLSHEETSEKLIYKLQQTDSSYRYKNGTQGSALDLIAENPVVGYGYGNDVYREIYNSRVADYPEWIFRSSLGPHNLILYIWFGAGIMGLAGLLFLYFSIGKECIQKLSYTAVNSPYNVYLFIFTCFIGYYIVRGNFEQIELNHLGILTGILISLKNSSKFKI